MRNLMTFIKLTVVVGLATSLSFCTDRKPKPVKETKKAPSESPDQGDKPIFDPDRNPLDPSQQTPQDPNDPLATAVNATPTPTTVPAAGSSTAGNTGGAPGGPPPVPGSGGSSSGTGNNGGAPVVSNSPDEIVVTLNNGKQEKIKWNGKDDIDVSKRFEIRTVP